MNLPPAPPLDESNNPYRGLESFDEEHSHLFFGRQALTEKLYQFVCARPLTVVLGASGSGKSSLVKAGLVPYIKQLEPDQQWRILPPMRPGESPFRALNNILAQEKVPIIPISNLTYQQFVESLSARMSAWCELNPKSKMLLVVDQVEELITLCRDDQEQRHFLSFLAEAINDYPEQLRLVLTLRLDFEAQLRDTGLERYWPTARFPVLAMTREQLRQVIEEPAAVRVMYFEPSNLVDQLIDEVEQMPGALPLLSFTLAQLYLKYLKSVREGTRSDRAITQADYEELGGVTRSLIQRADCEYDELVQLHPAYARTVQHVMLRMVAVGGSELARRRVLLSELEYPEPENERVKQVLQRFSAARLLVEGQDIEDNLYGEPAHDALVQGWPKLLTWKKQQQENLILQRRLTPAAEEWKSQRQARFLWHADPRLDLLKHIFKSTDNWFNKIEAEFVLSSVRQKRNNTVGRWSLVTCALVALSIITIIAIKKSTEALKRSLETSNASSEVLLDSHRQLEALVEGVKAGELLKKNMFWVGEDTRIRVITTLQNLIDKVKERNDFEAHDKRVTGVSFSPNGQMMASSSEDGSIRLWRRNGELLQTLSGHQNGVLSVSFCRTDGRTLISAGRDDTAKLWQRQPDGTFKLRKLIKDKSINTVSLSPDCRTVATANIKSFAVKLWHTDGKLIRTFLPKHVDRVKELDFSPDGQTLASASEVSS